MIIRGTAIHCDGHGKCDLFTSAFLHRLTPYMASPFGFFRQELDGIWRLVTSVVKRTRMRVMRESALCHGCTGESWQGSFRWSACCCFLF